MVRGQPDFGALAAKDVTASISDMGEVSARLGSIVTYDKRGDVVDFDNFEEPILKWAKIETGGAVYLHSVDVKSGSQSCALSTNANIGDSVFIYKYLSLLISRQLGFELAMGGDLSGLFYLNVYYYNGTDLYSPKVKIDLDEGKLYVYDGDLEDYTLVSELGGIFCGIGDNLFHNLKVVCDFETGKYIRIMFTNQEWDISSITIFNSTDASAAHAELEIGRENTDAEAKITSIEDVIWTQAEP